MLKVRIIAIVIALLLTALTVYLVPIAIDYYNSFSSGLSEEERGKFYWAQAGVGFLIAAVGFWGWKKKKSKPDDQ